MEGSSVISTRNREQTVTFERTSPHAVYEGLLDAKKFEALSGKKAAIDRQVGGGVTAYDGFVRAVQIELIPDKKIVQAWKGGVPQWPKDHYSIVVFSLEPAAKGTRLTFTQIGVPESAYSIIDPGWSSAYWEPMKKYFQGVEAH